MATDRYGRDPQPEPEDRGGGEADLTAAAQFARHILRGSGEAAAHGDLAERFVRGFGRAISNESVIPVVVSAGEVEGFDLDRLESRDRWGLYQTPQGALGVFYGERHFSQSADNPEGRIDRAAFIALFPGTGKHKIILASLGEAARPFSNTGFSLQVGGGTKSDSTSNGVAEMFAKAFDLGIHVGYSEAQQSEQAALTTQLVEALEGIQTDQAAIHRAQEIVSAESHTSADFKPINPQPLLDEVQTAITAQVS